MDVSGDRRFTGAAAVRPVVHAAARGFGRTARRRRGHDRRPVAAFRRNTMNAPRTGDAFAARLLAWFDVSGRHDLPWQHPRSPYRVWLSEIMLDGKSTRL